VGNKERSEKTGSAVMFKLTTTSLSGFTLREQKSTIPLGWGDIKGGGVDDATRKVGVRGRGAGGLTRGISLTQQDDERHVPQSDTPRPHTAGKGKEVQGKRGEKKENAEM